MNINYATRFFWAGVLMVALGLVVLFNAAVTSGAIVIVTGLVLLIGGAAQVGLGLLEESTSHKWLSLTLGVLMLLLGWSFLSNPLSGVISLSTFLLILLAASGVVQVVFGFRARGTPFFGPFISAGLISLGLAIILLASPTATMSLLGILLGVHLLATGGYLLLMAMFMKKVRVLTD